MKVIPGVNKRPVHKNEEFLHVNFMICTADVVVEVREIDNR